MNLNYFKNQDGDYIIYRYSNCQNLDNYIFIQTIYTTFSIFPKEDNISIEKFIDEQIQKIIQQEVDRLHLSSIKDCLNFQIVVSLQNLDISNPIFKNKILLLEDIDNKNTFYKFIFTNSIYLPINKKNILRNPFLFIKSLRNSRID